MNTKILVTGSQGLVGSRFVELYENKDELLTPSLEEFDFLKPKLLTKYIGSHKISAVVNFAAYTDVSLSETERGNKNGLCWKVNVEGTNNLISSLRKRDVHFIQISTDMVFGGAENDPGPYEIDHPACNDPALLTWYGYIKMLSEINVQKYFNSNAAIVRINYPVRSHFAEKYDFLRKYLKLYDEGKMYPLFSNQQLSISFIDEVYMALSVIIKNGKTGVFHAASSDVTTPYDIVTYLINRTRNNHDTIKSQKIEDFIKNTGSSSIRYPKYSGLEVAKTQNLLGISFSSCKHIVDELIEQGVGTET